MSSDKFLHGRSQKVFSIFSVSHIYFKLHFLTLQRALTFLSKLYEIKQKIKQILAEVHRNYEDVVSN